MKYIIKYRMTYNGNAKVGRVSGMVFYELKQAQEEADRLNDGAGPHLTYWPEEVREWESAQTR